MRSYYYKGDPYWTRARFPSRCRNCGKQIRKGEQIFYFPKGRHVYCDSEGCGVAEANYFAGSAFDEFVYHR